MDTSKQTELNIKEKIYQNEENRVYCLGMIFKDELERREYFTEELRKRLPEIKGIEGYPCASDEDILKMSDPPYYTACPNPFIGEFINVWEKEKDKIEGRSGDYPQEPFSADVSEGKNDPIYNAHFYHTKVPYKAIQKYIFHYTKPGDIVFDGFSGSGMTGIAAQMCGDKEAYYIEKGVSIGRRRFILSDISPSATFISKNNNIIGKFSDIGHEIDRIITKVFTRNQYLLETNHVGWQRGVDDLSKRQNREVSSALSKGMINYTVWSDVFVCENCGEELVYWDMVFVGPGKPVNDKLICRHCGAIQNEKRMGRKYERKFVKNTDLLVDVAKQIPVLINYTFAGKRYEKYPDEDDVQKLSIVENANEPVYYRIREIPDGFNTNQPKQSHGLLFNHQFFSPINLHYFNEVMREIENSSLKGHERHFLLFLLSASVQRTLKFNRYMPNHDRHVGPLSGTLYISQLTAEIPIINYMMDKMSDIRRCSGDLNRLDSGIITTQSTGNLQQMPDECIDYIFTDPPFGENLNYSELNSIWESFTGIITNTGDEAIINSYQRKGLAEYQSLIEKCFKEMFRILKSGKWITVEFHNSKNSVWNSIQEALWRAGFVIADVRVLDKKKGTTKQLSYTTTAKQDLVISAYKPNCRLQTDYSLDSNDTTTAWSFVREHLERLPVFIGEMGKAEFISERSPRVLYDRMIAYHVQNGISVPLTSSDFQEGIFRIFPMRDGMVFLEKQVAEYDKRRIQVKEFVQASLFVSDENSAIEWLRQQLLIKPQTRQDLHPGFMKEIQHIAKHELLPEMDVLLEQNFLQYDGTGPVPSQIHTYLSTNYKDMRELEKENPALQSKAKNRWYVPDPNKQADLDKLREKSLLKEFAAYVEEISQSKKKLKQFRLEAIRAGFKKAWGEKDFKTIVDIGSKLPGAVLQEDDKLLMYYDNAQIRMGV